jgi:ABC-type Co2+ transport system permease subunit
MTIDSATAVELVDMVAGILISVVALHACKKFNFAILRRGCFTIAVSGALMAVSSGFRAYYTYADLLELIPWGRAFLTAARITLLIGIGIFVLSALKIWGEEG